jgi:hypothetical protein
MTNNMLKEAVFVNDDTLQAKDVLEEITKIVPKGWFILERPQEAVMDVIDNLTKDLVDNATSVRAFSVGTEIRIERDFGEAEFQRRVIKTGEGGERHYKEHSYLLAKTKAIKMENGGSGESLLKCREYFRFDEDGMAWPTFERLVGVEIKAAEKKEGEE